MDINIDQGIPHKCITKNEFVPFNKDHLLHNSRCGEQSEIPIRNVICGDLVRFKSGKYIYKFPNGDLDIDRFSRDFDQYKYKRKENMIKSMSQKIQSLNTPIKENFTPNKLTMETLMRNTKNTILNIIEEVKNNNFGWNTLMKDNRLFYLGIILIVISFIFFLIF